MEATTAALMDDINKINWWHKIDLGNGITTPGRDDSPTKLAQVKLPQSLEGLSVLDIGAWDGFFSYECERRGARRVVALDKPVWDSPAIGKRGFELARRVLGSKVEDVELEVLDISPERVGVFDLVLFLGVLYHMPHPLLALERVASVAGKQLILETHVDMNEHDRPVLAFYPEDECNNDASNWFGPNRAAVEAMLRVVGFRKVELVSSTLVLCNQVRAHSWRRQQPVRPHGVPCLEVTGGHRSGRRCGAFTCASAASSDATRTRRKGIASMRPNITIRAQGPIVYVDAKPLSDKHLTGIGRYTARICMALAARGARVRFFTDDRELLPPPGLDWSPDQDLGRWGARLWQGGRIVPLAAVPDDAVGLWTCTRPCERTFPVELSILHDLTPLIVPFTHEPHTQSQSSSTSSPGRCSPPMPHWRSRTRPRPTRAGSATFPRIASSSPIPGRASACFGICTIAT